MDTLRERIATAVWSPTGKYAVEVDAAINRIETLVRLEVCSVLDRLEETKLTADNCTDDTFVVKSKFVVAERAKYE